MATKPPATVIESQVDVSLDNLVSQAERDRLSVLYFLEQRVGQDRSGQARAENKDFDWNAFKTAFRAAHGKKSLKDLLAISKRAYGIGTVAEARKQRSLQIGQRNRRVLAKNA